MSSVVRLCLRAHWLLLLVLFVVVQALTQPGFAQQAGSPAVSPSVTLGASRVPLIGPWRFHPGDSPVVNNAPLWARPGFEDKGWTSLALPVTADGSDLDGWTQRGYPQLTEGYAWYRLTVHIEGTPGPLSLRMPDAFDDAFQLYANGQLVGQYGFAHGAPVALYSRPLTFRLPSPDSTGTLTLALRFWLDPNSRFLNQDIGGLHGPPLLGTTATLQPLQKLADNTTILSQVAVGGFLPLFYLLVTLVALWAWWKVREETAFLTLALLLLINVLSAVVYEMALAGLLSQNAITVWTSVILEPIIAPCWILFWWQWFRLRSERWILHAVFLLLCGDLVTAICARALLYHQLPASFVPLFHGIGMLLRFAERLILLVVLIKAFLRDRTEALLALVPVILNELAFLNTYALAFRLFWTTPLLGINILPGAVSSFLLTLVVALLAVRRFMLVQTQSHLEQQALELDILQASELQQRVLVPEVLQSKHFHVQSAYLPARVVGGDFFQVLSDHEDGILVVVGDVSGKGMAAAMLVAVLVGTIATRAEESFDPLGMLQVLNARLLGRSEGHFATCVAMHLKADGTVFVANAGHLPPYLNGREVHIEPSLPLGLITDPEISTSTFHLRSMDWLTLITDGIVEATNGNGEMLGFDRAGKLSAAPAQQIAKAAQQHGQCDDITAVTLQYVFEDALAMA